MALTVIIFLVIALIFIFSTIGSWIYTRHSLKNHTLSFKDLNEKIIKKYNLMDYSLVDKKSLWINLSIFNLILYLIDNISLLFPFLTFKYDNSLFICSIVFAILGSIVCLAINLTIAFFMYKNNYSKNKEMIKTNMNEFISKLSLYKCIAVDEFTKTNIYNFRDKIYQKHFNKSLSKIKFKSDIQWAVKHYIVFLRYSQFFIFNLKNSEIQYVNSNFETICNQLLNNLTAKVNNNYCHKK